MTAASAVATPDAEVIRCTPERTPSAFSSSWSFDTYEATFGPTNAFRPTVEKRSYSRYCGITSEETERNASGNSSRTISATRCSCAALRNEKRKQTHTASTPASFSARTWERAASSSSGTRTLPSFVIRSGTVSRYRRRTTGYACHGRSW